MKLSQNSFPKWRHCRSRLSPVGIAGLVIILLCANTYCHRNRPAAETEREEAVRQSMADEILNALAEKHVSESELIASYGPPTNSGENGNIRVLFFDLSTRHPFLLRKEGRHGFTVKLENGRMIGWGEMYVVPDPRGIGFPKNIPVGATGDEAVTSIYDPARPEPGPITMPNDYWSKTQYSR